MAKAAAMNNVEQLEHMANKEQNVPRENKSSAGQVNKNSAKADNIIPYENKQDTSKESKGHAASETGAEKKPSVLEQLNKNKKKIEIMNQQGQEKQRGTVQHEDRKTAR